MWFIGCIYKIVVWLFDLTFFPKYAPPTTLSVSFIVITAILSLIILLSYWRKLEIGYYGAIIYFIIVGLVSTLKMITTLSTRIDMIVITTGLFYAVITMIAIYLTSLLIKNKHLVKKML